MDFFTVVSGSFIGFLLGAVVVEAYLRIQDQRAKKKYEAFFASFVEPAKTAPPAEPTQPA